MFSFYIFLTAVCHLAQSQDVNITALVRLHSLEYDPQLRVSQVILAADYFQHKEMSYASGVLCWSDAELAVLWRELSSRGIRFTAWRQVSAHDEHRDSALAAVQHVVRGGRAPLGMLLDMTCPYAKEFIEQSSRHIQFAATRNWLILESEETQCEELEVVENLLSSRALKQANISVDAEITVAVRCESNKSEMFYHLYDEFNYGRLQGGTLKIISKGQWSSCIGLEIWLNSYKYERRSDFSEVTLRAVTVVPQPVRLDLLSEPGSSDGITTLMKICNDILLLQSDKLNFSVSYIIKDVWMGSSNFDDNKSISSAMYHNEGDISATCIRVFTDRLKYMDPLLPLTYIETKVFYRTPSDGVGALRNEFGRPFGAGVWAAVVGAAVACGAALTVAGRIERLRGAGQFAVFTVLATTFQQVFEMGPPKVAPQDISRQDPVAFGDRLSGRLIIFVSSLSSLMLFNYYTSTVVSFLLSAPPPAINSITDLIESPLELVFEDIGYTRSWIEIPNFYFRQNRPPEENTLREKKVQKANKKHPLFLPLKEGIELVRKGGVAYHTEPDTAYDQISTTFTAGEICDLGAMQMMDRVPVFMVAQSRSPYKEIFVVNLLQASERGHVMYAHRRFGSLPPLCSEASVPLAVALGGFAPALIALLAACVLSMLLLLGENIMYRRNSPHIERPMKTTTRFRHLPQNQPTPVMT